jgi:hypothetical protein
MLNEAGRGLLKQVSSLVLARVGNFARDYGVEGIERLCLPIESPLGRSGSIVGGER